MSSLITYFEVLTSLIIAFFFFKWFIVKCAECSARYELEAAIRWEEPHRIKAVLIARAKRLSSEEKLDAQNYLETKYKM